MVKSAIEQMYYDSRGRNDFVPTGEKWSKSMDKVIKYYEELSKVLEKYPELKTLFEKFDKAIGESHAEECLNCYSEGFKFGVMLGIEIAPSTVGNKE